ARQSSLQRPGPLFPSRQPGFHTESAEVRSMTRLSIGKRALLIAAGILWVAAIGFGMRTLIRYESTPGALADAGQTWPTDSTLRRKAGQPTLVLLAHPQCV